MQLDILTALKPELKARLVSDYAYLRLKLKCDEPLSNVAFKFNVRRYRPVLKSFGILNSRLVDGILVGRCRLTVSNPEVKARLV